MHYISILGFLSTTLTFFSNYYSYTTTVKRNFTIDFSKILGLRPAGGADYDVELLHTVEDGPVTTLHLRHHTPTLPSSRGGKTEETLPDVDGRPQQERNLQEDQLEYPDGNVVHRAISKLRVELLSSQTFQIFHDESPEFDDIVPVHVRSGLYHCRLGSEVLHLHSHPETTGSPAWRAEL